LPSYEPVFFTLNETVTAESHSHFGPAGRVSMGEEDGGGRETVLVALAERVEVAESENELMPLLALAEMDEAEIEEEPLGAGVDSELDTAAEEGKAEPESVLDAAELRMRDDVAEPECDAEGTEDKGAERIELTAEADEEDTFAAGATARRQWPFWMLRPLYAKLV
jgi:hypothetical protein